MKRAALFLGLLWSGSCQAGDFPFVPACEEAIKEGLIAPSTYRRIKLTEGQERITFDELLAGYPENAKKLLRMTAKREPVRMVAVLEYDAMNAFGVPLRQTSKCTYQTASDFAPDVDEARRLVKIDGEYVSRADDQVGEFTLRRHRPD